MIKGSPMRIFNYTKSRRTQIYFKEKSGLLPRIETPCIGSKTPTASWIKLMQTSICFFQKKRSKGKWIFFIIWGKKRHNSKDYLHRTAFNREKVRVWLKLRSRLEKDQNRSILRVSILHPNCYSISLWILWSLQRADALGTKQRCPLSRGISVPLHVHWTNSWYIYKCVFLFITLLTN